MFVIHDHSRVTIRIRFGQGVSNSAGFSATRNNDM